MPTVKGKTEENEFIPLPSSDEDSELSDEEEHKSKMPSDDDDVDQSDSEGDLDDLIAPFEFQNAESKTSQSVESEDSELSDHENNLEEDGSDAEPEAVSFKSAQEAAHLLKSHTKDIISRHNEERRKKRKELQDRIKSLSDEKKRKIEEKMLQNNILQNLNDEPINSEDDSQSNDEENAADNDSDVDASAKEITEEHEATVFKCKILSQESWKPSYVAEPIRNLKEQMLFGGRIRREKSTQHALLKKEKQLARQK